MTDINEEMIERDDLSKQAAMRLGTMHTRKNSMFAGTLKQESASTLEQVMAHGTFKRHAGVSMEVLDAGVQEPAPATAYQNIPGPNVPNTSNYGKKGRAPTNEYH